MGFSVFGYDIPLNPCSGNRGIIWNFIFGLAAFNTKTAAHTFSRIDQKSPTDLIVSYSCLEFRRVEKLKG